MSDYNKLFAAILSTLLARWLLQFFGVDATALGVASDLQEFAGWGINAAAAAFAGFWVWLVPNGRNLWRWLTGIFR